MSDISYHCKLPIRRQPGVMSGTGRGRRHSRAHPCHRPHISGGRRPGSHPREHPELTEAEVFAVLFFAAEYPEWVERDRRAEEEGYKALVEQIGLPQRRSHARTKDDTHFVEYWSCRSGRDQIIGGMSGLVSRHEPSYPDARELLAFPSE